MVQCKCCRQLIHQDLCVKRDVWNGKVWKTMYFCSHHCKNQWYLSNLRTLGM